MKWYYILLIALVAMLTGAIAGRMFFPKKELTIEEEITEENPSVDE